MDLGTTRKHEQINGSKETMNIEKGLSDKWEERNDGCKESEWKIYMNLGK